MSRLVLASRSPQRRAILDQIGVAYQVEVPDVEELQSGPPHEVALENAFRKAFAVAARAPGALVLGVDTLVTLGARLYGKPADEDEARTMLSALAGRRHTVVSGLCLIEDGRPRTAAASTVVEFRARDEALIDWYLASGEWRERAGAYAIQGRGAALVARIEGDFLNVVGLPVTTLLELAPALLGRVKHSGTSAIERLERAPATSLRRDEPVQSGSDGAGSVAWPPALSPPSAAYPYLA